MAENYDEKLKNMSERAKAELYNMQSRAMPPMPSFVRPVSNGFNQQNGGQGGSRGDNREKQSENQQNQQNQNPDIPPTLTDTAQEPKKKGLFGLDILKILDAKGFELDSDRILLLLLILLLSGEGGDEILMFALAYLML